MGYYNEEQNKIIFIYQADNSIKYFMISNNLDIFSFGSFSDTINTWSYHEIQYDLKEKVTMADLEDLGYLNVDYIKYRITDYTSDYEYFGIDFNDILMSDNNLIPELSLNDWKTYFLSFVDHVDNKYTRIYHLTSFKIEVQTCKKTCGSCWDNFDTCTDCENNENYAPLIDRSDECFPPSYLVDCYIYDSNSNKFLNCYESCEFCSAVSTSSCFRNTSRVSTDVRLHALYLSIAS